MSVNVGRPPINPAYKVRPFYVRDNSKKVFDAMWGAAQTAPNSPVSIIAASRVKIDAVNAKIEIYQLVDGKKYDVCLFQVPIIGGKVNRLWTAEPVKSGDFEEGVYHFEITAGIYWGETQKPLLIRDITNRNASIFEHIQINPSMPKF